MADCGASCTRESRDSGQVLAVAAAGLAVFLMVFALAIDGGFAFWAKRSLQSSADAAALAGAQSLPNAATATNVAYEYSGRKSPPGRNYSSPLNTQTTVTTECRSGTACPDTVVVVETATVPTFFARVLGLGSYDVRARAVAQKISASTGPSAIHAHEPCGNKGLKFNGNGMNIQGAIHSNGNFEVDANMFTSGPATIHRPQSSCITKPPPEKAGVSFDGDLSPTQEPTARPWPVTFTYAEFCSSGGPVFGPNNGSDYTVSKSYPASGSTMASGVYCIPNGKFELDVTNIKGNVSIVAREIIINAIGSNLTPYRNNVLLFQTGVGYELKANAESYTWTGYIYSPFSHVVINGSSNSAYAGFIVAKSILINGSEFKMTGTFSGGSSTSTIGLIE